MNNQKLYFTTKLNIIFHVIVFVGAFNYGAMAFGYNFLQLFSNYINQYFTTSYPIDKILYGIITISALYLAFKRDTWLPFLGRSVLPSTLIPLQTPNDSNKIIEIKTKPNSKIAYWAALPKGENPDVNTAYDNYSNSGVVMSDSNGIAKLPILEGSGYIVPSGKKISRHIHYRLLDLPFGMIDRIKTVKY